MTDQPFVVGAFQQRIGHAQYDDLRLSNPGMHQRVDVADIAVSHMHAAIDQRSKHVGIEIDHADLIEQQSIPALDLGQQCAGRAEKSQDHDPPGLAMPLFVFRVGGVAVIQIANPDPLQQANGNPRDRVTAHHRKRAQHRQNHECERHRTGGFGLDMPAGDPGLNHHQRKLADLGQIDRWQQAGPQTLLHQIKRREGREQPAGDREGCDHQREADHRKIGDGDRHAERDKEQRDEEIAQRRDLGGDVQRIGKGR